jgi:hypothetical protein
MDLSGQRVVRDAATGRMWQGCVAGRNGFGCESGTPSAMTWQAALAYCDALPWGAYDDWRLPDRNELLSIVGRDGSCVDPAVFPETPSSDIWSSSSRTGLYERAWGVHFSYGPLNYREKVLLGHVRCIRGGP